MYYVNEEYGQKVYVNIGQDISTATNLEIHLIPEMGEVKKRTATVGASNITVNDENFIANEYLEYTTVSGDIDYNGLWKARGFANITATNRVIRENIFRVN